MARKCIPFLLSILCLLLVSSSNGRKLQSKVSYTSKLARATNPRDVQGVGAIIRQFPQLNLLKGSNYGADPCLPISWTWVACNNNPITPRVTALYLSNRNLIGPIPDFSTMDALERIYMYNNSLTGTIPSFLGTLPYLQTLYLFNNLLSGNVPASIVQNKNLTKGLFGNPMLIQVSPPPSPRYFTTLPYVPEPREHETRSVRVRVKFRPLKLIILGAVLAAVLLFFCLAAIFGALCGCGAKETETAEPTEPAANAGEEETKAPESTDEAPVGAAMK